MKNINWNNSTHSPYLPYYGLQLNIQNGFEHKILKEGS